MTNIDYYDGNFGASCVASNKPHPTLYRCTVAAIVVFEDVLAGCARFRLTFLLAYLFMHAVYHMPSMIP